ncbi:MAG: DUF2318 domain-containing protein [Deltaproteobacteria bacterium]|nr:DUF2318 domain-containing protein [Deltaproteobacteria bacterium]
MSKKKQNQKKSKNQSVQTKTSAEKRAAKKDAVLGTEKKRPLPTIILAVVGVIIIAGAIIINTQFGGNKSSTAGFTTADTTVKADAVTYAVDNFTDGTAKYYKYIDNRGMTIKFFVLKSSDGIIRAAFDACDVCWRAGKGYAQQGDAMVCRNCGRRFASVLVNEVKGGCNPAPLKRSIENGQVVIRVSDILEGRQYFDFANRG